MCRRCIEDKVAFLRAQREQREAIQQAIDELLLEGAIRWTGEYRNGSPVYVAVKPEDGDAADA